MNKIVAIAGGSSKPFLKEIIRLAKKKNPRVLVIPTARDDRDDVEEKTSRHFSDRKCKVESLYLIKEASSKEAIADKVFNSDIIYVEGGNTINMLRVWRTRGVHEILRQAHQKGIVLSGISAGAICWFKTAISGPLPSRILFSLPSTFKNELASGHPEDPGKKVSDDLRKVFIKNGISLSEDTVVYWLYGGLWGHRKGLMWRIYDRDNNQQHYIRKKEGKLYVYKTERFMQSTGLGVIPGKFCCHYKQRKKGLRGLMRKTSGVAIGADDQCAIVVIDNKYRIISESGENAYRVFWKRGKFYEEVIEQKAEMTPITTLLKK